MEGVDFPEFVCLLNGLGIVEFPAMLSEDGRGGVYGLGLCQE